MSYVRIPLDCTPFSQRTFKLTLEGNRNVNILLKLRYHDLYDLWLADIIDNATGTALIVSLPMVLGINLLEQYEYMNIGKAYLKAVEPTDLMQPDNKTLGSTFVLIWGDDS